MFGRGRGLGQGWILLLWAEMELEMELFLTRRCWFLIRDWNDVGSISDNRGIKPVMFIESLSLLEFIEKQ